MARLKKFNFYFILYVQFIDISYRYSAETGNDMVGRHYSYLASNISILFKNKSKSRDFIFLVLYIYSDTRMMC